MLRVLLILLGGLSLVVGVIGIFLPILPTTPFVLCAAGCFSASHPPLYRWLERTKYFGEYIKNYRNKTGVSTRTRVIGITFLWLTLGISAFFFRHIHVWIILGIVGVAVTIHLLLIRRKK